MDPTDVARALLGPDATPEMIDKMVETIARRTDPSGLRTTSAHARASYEADRAKPKISGTRSEHAQMRDRVWEPEEIANLERERGMFLLSMLPGLASGAMRGGAAGAARGAPRVMSRSAMLRMRPSVAAPIEPPVFNPPTSEFPVPARSVRTGPHVKVPQVVAEPAPQIRGELPAQTLEMQPYNTTRLAELQRRGVHRLPLGRVLNSAQRARAQDLVSRHMADRFVEPGFDETSIGRIARRRATLRYVDGPEYAHDVFEEVDSAMHGDPLLHDAFPMRNRR